MKATHLLSDLLSRVSDIGRSLITAEESKEELGDRCESLLSGRGEATGLALGRQILDRYNELDTVSKKEFFDEIMLRFGVDEEKLTAAVDAWSKDKSHELARELYHV